MKSLVAPPCTTKRRTAEFHLGESRTDCDALTAPALKTTGIESRGALKATVLESCTLLIGYTAVHLLGVLQCSVVIRCTAV